MSERLSLTQILLLAAYAIGMVAGQLLFKAAALRVAGDAPLVDRAVGLLQNGFFLAAMALYFALSVLWVWILTFTPLSRAYPFMALAFALTPIVGGLLFTEPMSARLLLGIAVVLGGLFLVAG
jgi:drug/metabolite transporter (DMT)-like permease